MKKLAICCILILALTNLAYAMGSHGGGKRPANVSSSGTSSSGTSSSGTSSSGTSSSGTSNGAPNTTNNSPIIIVSAGLGEQNSGGDSAAGSPNGGIVPVPEPSTMLLLGSALFGLWGLKRKIKK